MVRNDVVLRILAALTLAAAMPLHAQEPNAYAWVYIDTEPQRAVGSEPVLPRQYQRALSDHLATQLARRMSGVKIVEPGHPRPATGPGIALSWTVLKFSPGDPEVRRQIGLGFGTTLIEVRYRFVDVDTGRMLLEGTADGKVIGGWGNGGDSLGAAKGLAKEIAARARRLPRTPPSQWTDLSTTSK